MHVCVANRQACCHVFVCLLCIHAGFPDVCLVGVCLCVWSRFSCDKTLVFGGITSPSPDSSMLCIYGGNKLICKGQIGNWLKLLLETVSLHLYLGQNESWVKGNIVRSILDTLHHASAECHSMHFDLARYFVLFPPLICHALISNLVLLAIDTKRANVLQALEYEHTVY